jgi:hypothetical protein
MSVSAEFNQSNVLPRSKAGSPGLSRLFQSWRQRNKTHHYQASNMGLDFSLEKSADAPHEIQMISQKAGVKKNDCIKIHHASEYTTYKILEIDFYSNVSDMWVARLAAVADQ